MEKVILVQSLKVAWMLMKGHAKQGVRQGQEPEGVKEYGKSQGSEWPGAAPLGVAMEKWPEGEWEPSQLLLCLPRPQPEWTLL